MAVEFATYPPSVSPPSNVRKEVGVFFRRTIFGEAFPIGAVVAAEAAIMSDEDVRLDTIRDETGAVLAAMTSHLSLDDPNEWFIPRLAVHPDTRRRGFGRAVLSHLATDLVATGRSIRRVTLCPYDTTSHEFYSSVGFSPDPDNSFEWNIHPILLTTPIVKTH